MIRIHDVEVKGNLLYATREDGTKVDGEQITSGPHTGPYVGDTYEAGGNSYEVV